jgi:integrase/recombinase XerD
MLDYVASKTVAVKSRYHSPLAELFREQLLIAGNVPQTANNYLGHVAKLSEYYRKPPNQLTEEQVRKYLLLRKEQLKLNSMRPIVAAFKFFYSQTVPRDWQTLRSVRIPRVRTLPVVLIPDKVWQLIDATEAFHWQVFFRTSYTAGLRSGDTRHLTIHDVEADRQQLHVRKTKNSNERIVPLPQATLEALREYWKTHRHPKWLFPSRANLRQLHLADRPVCAKSVQRALQKVAGSLNWKIPGLCPHSLRHSYATAMLEAGVNIKVLQSYLGHRNLKATEIYLHLTRNSDQKARKVVEQLMNGPEKP